MLGTWELGNLGTWEIGDEECLFDLGTFPNQNDITFQDGTTKCVNYEVSKHRVSLFTKRSGPSDTVLGPSQESHV